MVDDDLENDLTEITKKVRMHFSIKKPPAYTLKECLSFYTKDQLFDIAYEHRYYLSKSKKKSEMVERFSKLLYDCLWGGQCRYDKQK